MKVACLGDLHSHGGQIITASHDMFVGGVPVARLGDLIMCRIHGRQPIIAVADTVTTNGRKRAHVGAICACGAVIITGNGTVDRDQK